MKRRKRLQLFSALVAVVGTLAVPGVHWRLIGWAKGEPFCEGRPLSYWRERVATSTPYFVEYSGDNGTVQMVVFHNEDYLQPGPTLLYWFKARLGRPEKPDSSPLPMYDPAALPVVVALLSDYDPNVRCCAAYALGKIHGWARPAVPSLLPLLQDGSQVTVAGSKAHRLDRPWTVGRSAAAALHDIDPAAWEAAGRP